jgi:hypothetical protein
VSATATIAAIVAALPSTAGFAPETHAPYEGVMAYTDETVVALYNFADGGDDDTIHVDVYDADGNGDTFFSQDLTGLPVAVAAAWVVEALAVRPPAGYAKGIAEADLRRAEDARDAAARAYAAAAARYDQAAAAYRKFV